VPPYLHDNGTTRGLLAAYYAEITQFDTQVGNLLKLLDDSGQADNTLVMFLSEQGSSFPYGGKWSVYDNGIRVSTLVRWPGKVKPGTQRCLDSIRRRRPDVSRRRRLDPSTVDVGCPDAHGKTGFDGRSFLDVLTGESRQLS
jgi:N-sulfoglucosamine sulfohydrolase